MSFFDEIPSSQITIKEIYTLNKMTYIILKIDLQHQYLRINDQYSAMKNYI